MSSTSIRRRSATTFGCFAKPDCWNANVATATPTTGRCTTPWPSSADLVLGGDDPNPGNIPNPVPGIRLEPGAESSGIEGQLNRIAEQLTVLFAGVFSAQTVERYVHESYRMLAARARVHRFLPSLTASSAIDHARTSASRTRPRTNVAALVLRSRRCERADRDLPGMGPCVGERA